MAEKRQNATPDELCFFDSSLADVGAILSIENSVHRNPWSQRQIEKGIADYATWVIQQNGEIAGYLFVMPVGDQWELLNIAVSSDFQNQGIGKKAIEFLRQTAEKAGVRRILLEVRESNTQAIRLYQTSGFIEDGRRKNYYPTESKREDAILMSFSLERL